MTKSLVKRTRSFALKLPSGLSSILVCVSVFSIRGYQRHISPLLGTRCRFYPTCSQYAVIALTEWGFFKGAWLTVKRLFRCGPWHDGGYDPPPRKKTKKAQG